jgi:hypothetical protein
VSFSSKRIFHTHAYTGYTGVLAVPRNGTVSREGTSADIPRLHVIHVSHSRSYRPVDRIHELHASTPQSAGKPAPEHTDKESSLQRISEETIGKKRYCSTKSIVHSAATAPKSKNVLHTNVVSTQYSEQPQNAS